MDRAGGTPDAKARVYALLEEGASGGAPARIVDRVLIALIIANVGAAIALTASDVATGVGGLLLALEVASGAIFTVEYLLRLWVADRHRWLRRAGPLKAQIGLRGRGSAGGLGAGDLLCDGRRRDGFKFEAKGDRQQSADPDPR